MRRVALIALAALAAASAGLAGCLRSTTFTCTRNEECTGSMPGRCEADGFCSFPDGSCSSGNRYGEHAGSVSGQCVGGAGSDGGIDGPLTGCPATYMTLAGAGTHVYRAIAASAIWSAHGATCTAEGAYLVEPDDAAELQAVNTLAGPVEIWIGITDQTTEGTFLTGRGGAAAFLPWETGQPDDAPGGADCARASATGTYADDRCTTPRAAVCECVPP